MKRPQKLTPLRLRVIKSKIVAWRALSDDNDPIGAMCNVLDELVAEIERRKASHG